MSESIPLGGALSKRTSFAKDANNYDPCKYARPTNVSHDALRALQYHVHAYIHIVSCQDQLIDNAEMCDLLTPAALGFIQGPVPFFNDTNTRQ